MFCHQKEEVRKSDLVKMSGVSTCVGLLLHKVTPGACMCVILSKLVKITGSWEGSHLTYLHRLSHLV